MHPYTVLLRRATGPRILLIQCYLGWTLDPGSLGTVPELRADTPLHSVTQEGHWTPDPPHTVLPRWATGPWILLSKVSPFLLPLTPRG